MTRTGWDMDPFVVVSFSKKIFRTRVIRHSLNPTWDEKLLFHVRRYETTFSVHFAVLDWDKLSSNDHVGDVSLPLARLLERAPKRDGETGVYPEEADGTQDGMAEFVLGLDMEKGVGGPELTIRCVACFVLRVSFFVSCVGVRFVLRRTMRVEQNTNPTTPSANVSGANTSNNTTQTTAGPSPASN